MSMKALTVKPPSVACRKDDARILGVAKGLIGRDSIRDGPTLHSEASVMIVFDFGSHGSRVCESRSSANLIDLLEHI